MAVSQVNTSKNQSWYHATTQFVIVTCHAFLSHDFSIVCTGVGNMIQRSYELNKMLDRNVNCMHMNKIYGGPEGSN